MKNTERNKRAGERRKIAVKLWKLPVDLKSGHAAINQDFSVLCWTKEHRGMIVEVATLKQSESVAETVARV